MDLTNNYAPLFESRLELVEPNLVFVPSLDPNDPKGFNCLLTGLVEDITHMSSLIPRIVKGDEHKTYAEIISNNNDIMEMKLEILNGVEKVVQEAADFCGDFERYVYAN